MRSIWIAFLVGGVLILLISSCATVPAEHLTPGELRLLRIYVPAKEDVRVNFPFMVNIYFEADGKPELRTACFYFSGNGPYCYKVQDVNYGSPGMIKMQVQAKNTGPCALKIYVYYIKEGKVQPSNIVDCIIRVSP